MNLFPNPTDGKKRLVLSDYLPVSAQLNLYDINGQLVTTRKVRGGANIFDFSDLLGGIYIYELLDQGRKMSSGKIVKVGG